MISFYVGGFMAFFGVTIEEISEILDHPNADRLSIAKTKNLAFQFVIQKNQFRIGEKVIYFPIDSLLPNELIKKLNMDGKFSGKEKNRVKTIKLRGQISQGYVTKTDIIPKDFLEKTPEELTFFLGVTKYEPPISFANDGILTELPPGHSKYDIEGADRFQHIIDILLDQEVLVSEKMEGTNHSVFVDNNGVIYVNQRNNSVIEKDGTSNSYWEVARKSGLIEYLSKQKNLTIYSEFCGPSINKNIYKLKEHTLFVFDIKKDGKWLNVNDFLKEVDSLLKETNVKIAPVLFKGLLKDFLETQTIQKKSNGNSLINSSTLREGIVVKPLIEQFHSELGRLIIKQRSPEYLSNEDN